MDAELESDDIKRQLRELEDGIKQFRNRCCYRSSMRLARELKARAKAGQQVVPYLYANFYIMNAAQETLEPDVGVETAIETIALLESEERARQFQPDFPQSDYDSTVQWMSACAYDNLGKHVAIRDGYNSEGVHSVIGDGIDVCRRTGKLGCIACFREYAADVFIASGDLEMAAHHASAVAGHPPVRNNDRRWVGAKKIAKIYLLQGQLSAARNAALEAFRLAPTYHSPLYAYLSTRHSLDEILLMQGIADGESVAKTAGYSVKSDDVPPDGEDVDLDLSAAKVCALRACSEGQFEAAFDLLRSWDQRLTKLRSLSDWFEVRLRLVALCALDGRSQEARELAHQLEQRCRSAGEWLTRERLRRLMEGSVRASPLALLQSVTEGQFSPPNRPPAAAAASNHFPELSSAAVNSTVPLAAETQESSAGDDPSRPAPFIHELFAELIESQGREESLRAIHDRVLAIELESVEVANARWLLFLEEKVVPQGDPAVAAWQWALRLAARFAQDGTTQNLTAWLGHVVRSRLPADSEAAPSVDQLEATFRKSLDLDVSRSKNFARAGWFYQDQGKNAEAERCLARAFTLDRTNAEAVLALAKLYDDSGRSQDALAVLDLAIRNGCDHPQAAWEAGLIAFHFERFEAALAYFDRFASQHSDRPWTDYYRAWSHLMLKRSNEAAAAIARERSHWKDLSPLHLELLDVWTASIAGDLHELRRRLKAVLSRRLREDEALAENGLQRLLARVYETAQSLPDDADERQSLETLLLASGLAPNELFEVVRKRSNPVEHLNFYICRLRQPLDDRWSQSAGCLRGQQSWSEYSATWGVLAPDEMQAEQAALNWQAKCYPIPAECIECSRQSGPYRDCPGVVWQGCHLAVES